jgi:hypothetical protein
MKIIGIFLVTFSVIMVLNQLGYGSCFAAYCIQAAIPKVTIFSIIVTAIIYFVSESNEKS